MKGLILAAGRGKRLSPITDTRPKPMIPIGGKPILQYIIENLKENHVNEITIVVGYKGEMIRDDQRPAAARNVFRPLDTKAVQQTDRHPNNASKR